MLISPSNPPSGSHPLCEVRHSISEVLQSYSEVRHSISEVLQSYGEVRHSISEVLQSYGEVRHSISEVLQSYGVVRHSISEVLQSHGEVRQSISEVLQSHGEVRHSISEVLQSYGEFRQSISEVLQSYGEVRHSISEVLHLPYPAAKTSMNFDVQMYGRKRAAGRNYFYPGNFDFLIGKRSCKTENQKIGKSVNYQTPTAFVLPEPEYHEQRRTATIDKQGKRRTEAKGGGAREGGNVRTWGRRGGIRRKPGIFIFTNK